jgi:hypothetical protein
MSTEKEPKEITVEDIKQQMTANDLAKTLRLTPSRRVILGLTNDHLVKHNALIFHKGSSLSSAQRKMVQERVAYGLNKGTITTEQVAGEINKLNALIQGELIKITKDDSITEHSVSDKEETGEDS